MQNDVNMMYRVYTRLPVIGMNALSYSLTRPPLEMRSSAQHGECVLRRVWDLSPGVKKKKKNN